MRMTPAAWKKLPAKVFNRDRKLKLVLLWQTKLFDVIHGTDTSVEVQKHDLNPASPFHENGTFYAASWTSEIRKSFQIVVKKLGRDFETFSFIDVGCGKGKVTIVWKRLCQAQKLDQAIFGIDYDHSLIETAQKNHSLVFGESGKCLCADATSFDYGAISHNLIVYLFNPFDEVVLGRLLDALESKNTIIIYNNPNHDPFIAARGWREFHRRTGVGGFNRTVMYERRNSSLDRP